MNIENLIGTQLADVLTGNALDNYIQAGSGDDQVYGLLGKDRLKGDAGSDTLIGGLGADTFDNDADDPNQAPEIEIPDTYVFFKDEKETIKLIAEDDRDENLTFTRIVGWAPH